MNTLYFTSSLNEWCWSTVASYPMIYCHTLFICMSSVPSFIIWLFEKLFCGNTHRHQPPPPPHNLYTHTRTRTRTLTSKHAHTHNSQEVGLIKFFCRTLARRRAYRSQYQPISLPSLRLAITKFSSVQTKFILIYVKRNTKSLFFTFAGYASWQLTTRCCASEQKQQSHTNSWRKSASPDPTRWLGLGQWFCHCECQNSGELIYTEKTPYCFVMKCNW
jgi:hypothetical protein